MWSDISGLRSLSGWFQWVSIGLVFVSGFLQLGRTVVDRREKDLSAIEQTARANWRGELLIGHEEEIAEKLMPFVGTKFDSAFDLSSKEQQAFWQSLQPVLATKSGWSNIPWSDGHTTPLWMLNAAAPSQANLPRSGSAAATNVGIHVFPEYREQLGPAAAALVSALKGIGITAAEADSNIVSVNKDAIHIWIGEKQ